MITNPIKFVYFVGDGEITEFSYAYNGTTGFDTKVASEVKAAILNPDGTRELNPNFAVVQDTYKNLMGQIKFATAPVHGAIIFIYRDTPQTQESDYKTSSGFNAQSIEKNLDKLTKEVQDLGQHSTQKTLQLDMFQEEPIFLALMSAINQNQYLFLDFANKVIKGGLYFEITDSDRFRVSQDGETWLYFPKSTNVEEIRQVMTEDNPRHYVFQYRVGNEWFNIDIDAVDAEAKEALAKAEQGIELANTANEKADELAETKADKTALEEEETERKQADTNLQSQIDAMNAASDVADVVGTYADLENYDTSKLTDNAIIKVLNDETQDGASTYYRWTIGA